MKPMLRAAITASAMAAAALAGLGVRDARLSGIFTSVTPGFSGVCRAVSGTASDFALDAPDGLVFIASGNARAPDGSPSDKNDGIYTMKLDGSGLARVAGVPTDFHPRALSLTRGRDGVLVLMAINARARSSVDIFRVIVTGGVAQLTQTSSVESGLLVHPVAIAATGADSFYVANDRSSKTTIGQWLEKYAMLPRGTIVYFSGMGTRVVADGIGAPGGIALTPDGRHLIVAATEGRALISFETSPFYGDLKQADSLSLATGPDKIAFDAHGALWVGGHPHLLALARYRRDASKPAMSQIFKVAMADGIPKDAVQVYGGTGVGAASAGLSTGGHLFIGSSLDDKFLDCAMK